jgi:hypothetical protein
MGVMTGAADSHAAMDKKRAVCSTASLIVVIRDFFWQDISNVSEFGKLFLLLARIIPHRNVAGKLF